MHIRVSMLLLLVTLTILLVSCAGPVIYLPTPTGFRPGPELPAQPSSGTPLPPALLEQRLIVLEWPLRVREKDSALILLTIAVDEQGNLTATAQSGGRIDPVPVEFPNIYDTHNLVAVARLDMAGVEAYREEIREPLRPGREITFRWSIRADEAGLYRGVVWLHIEFVPRTTGQVEQQLLMARTIDVEALTVFGMSGGLARGLGVLGLIASSVLGFPYIQKQIENWLKSRKKTHPTSHPAAGAKPESEEVERPEK